MYERYSAILAGINPHSLAQTLLVNQTVTSTSLIGAHTHTHTDGLVDRSKVLFCYSVCVICHQHRLIISTKDSHFILILISAGPFSLSLPCSSPPQRSSDEFVCSCGSVISAIISSCCNENKSSDIQGPKL